MSMAGTYSNGTIKYRSKRYDLHPPHKPKDISKQVNKRLAKLFGD